MRDFISVALRAGAVSPSGRPKLQMKTRDPRLGPPGQVSAPIAQADPPPEPQPAQPAMQPDPAGGRPRLVLKKRTDPVQAAASAPAVAAPPAAVRVAPDPPPEPQPAQPAMQPDPAGGRPRLVLKKRTDPVQAAASAPAVAAPPAAVRVSSPPPIALDLEACDCWCGGIIIFFCNILHPMTQLKQTSAKHAQDVP
eukprot:symbB.v1.2.039982.t1/scaffold6825.1/size15212/2